MFYDPAHFEGIGEGGVGRSNLTQTLPGYRVVPYPFLGTLQGAMHVGGIYTGDTLFNIVWERGSDKISLLDISPNYEESLSILQDIFPKNKVIFLMCGGGGYSALTKLMLIELGWDADLIYNNGSNWNYRGENSICMQISEDNKGIATWRVEYTEVDFDRLTELG
jgi:rhodanese-related sulfurtransferase